MQRCYSHANNPTTLSCRYIAKAEAFFWDTDAQNVTTLALYEYHPHITAVGGVTAPPNKYGLDKNCLPMKDAAGAAYGITEARTRNVYRWTISATHRERRGYEMSHYINEEDTQVERTATYDGKTNINDGPFESSMILKHYNEVLTFAAGTATDLTEVPNMACCKLETVPMRSYRRFAKSVEAIRTNRCSSNFSKDTTLVRCLSTMDDQDVFE